jgi:8-oxo-dGTP pyrophosphatase MutT (NUDIX family)
VNKRFARVDNSRIVYQTDWIAVREYKVERDGVRGTYSVIERPDAVVVIPLTSARKTALLKQFRFPTNDNSWEFPMGAVGASEPAEAAARRELMEEIGMRAPELIKVGEYRPAPGLTPQIATVFVAPIDDETFERSVAASSTSEEIQEIVSVSLAELAAMISDGRLTDGYSLAGFLLVRLWLDQGHGSNG